MDIGSKNEYPASALSNFASHPFVFDGIPVTSFEGLLQSFKFSNTETQKHVCALTGWNAKVFGRNEKWWVTRHLFWQGEVFNRDSDEYQRLLDLAYREMFDQSESFRKALRATGDAVLTHSIGKASPKVTILTSDEFCGRLMRLRAMLK
jgi:predicted NAD-dependent protein-ADP-ribosyltransferase YbiA (DUF1768 family)